MPLQRGLANFCAWGLGHDSPARTQHGPLRLERWAGKATVARHGGLVLVGGQRAARHGPGRARAPALPRAQAHR